MFERSVIQSVRAATDIVELVRAYAPLRKQGSRFTCRCPFHEEKSPSFNVSGETQLAFCFGCKWGGDAIKFVMHLEGLDFPEALRFLAEKAGVELPETRDPAVVAEDRRQRDQAARLFAACEAATVFFESQLATAPFSELARGALEDRGITPETAAAFRLGYAPAAWSDLAAHLARLGVSPADAEMAGLTLPSRSGPPHDRFRHRLMFPVTDRGGRVVAFSGRVLPGSEEMPEGVVLEGAGKYINSPETPIYRKHEHLYGLHPARDAIRRSAEAVLVEGNFDVVQMHQHGFTQTVAPLGTSFTDDQAKLLRRVAERVTLVFDGDGAGRKAARASYATCEKAGLAARVGVLPREVDPDAFLRDARPGRGVAGMREVLDRAQGMIEWLIKDTTANADPTLTGRVAALRTLAPLLTAVADRIERIAAVRMCAKGLMLDEGEVRQAVRDHEAKVAREAKASPYPVTASVSERPGMTEIGDRSDTSAHGEKRARAAGIEAVLYDPTLLAGEGAYQLLRYLDEPVASVVRVASSQWAECGRLDGPSLLECVEVGRDPEGKVRGWLAARMIPADEAVVERCPSALRDALAKLQRCREAREAEAARRESARRGANGDREGEVAALEHGPRERHADA